MASDFQQTVVSATAGLLGEMGDTRPPPATAAARLTAAVDRLLDVAASASEASRDDLRGCALLLAKLLTIVREAHERGDASMEVEAESILDFVGAASSNLQAALEDESAASLDSLVQQACQRWGDWVRLVDDAELLRDGGTADCPDASGFSARDPNGGDGAPEAPGEEPPSEEQIRLLLSALESRSESGLAVAKPDRDPAAEAAREEPRLGTRYSLSLPEPRAAAESGAAGSPSPADPPEMDTELWEAFLDDARRCLAAMEAAGLALEADPRDQRPLQQICRELHTLKGASASVGMRDVARYLHDVEDTLQQQCRGGSFRADVQAILGTVDAVRRRLAAWTGRPSGAPEPSGGAVPPGESPPPSSASAWQEAPPQAGETIRVKSHQLDRLLDMLAQLVMLRNRRESRVAQLREIHGELTGCVTRLRTVDDGAARGAARAGQGLVSPAISSVTEIANDILEIARGLRELYEPLAEENAAVSGFIRQFRQELVELSRLPASGLFRRLQRAVRDAARAEGKRVRLETAGEDVGLDRSLQEKLYEPLLHIVRNAVSHGIEPESKRLAAGKNAEGCVTLAARGGTNLLVIEVRDDGKGLDYEAIRRRGIERGLLPADRPVSRQELCQLVFQPGFSTRSRSSETAGRGVGMDVVAMAVERMRGWVELQSTPGAGTCVRLSVPLRSAIEHAMVFRAGGQLFALPLQCIHRAGQWDAEVRRQGDAGARTGTGETAGRIAEGHGLAPVHLAKLFGLKAPPAAPAQALILEREGPARPDERLAGAPPSNPRNAENGAASAARRLALLVEEIVGPEEVVVRPLPPLLRGQRGFSGVTLSGTGEIVLLLDGRHLAEWAAASWAAGPTASRSPAPRPDFAGERPILLVVDDSLSARRTLAKMLQAHGCDVLEAADGVEALECLSRQRVTAVLTDLEMPRRDGLDLLREVRSDPEMRSIPVVVVTSRDDDVPRRRARDLGALAYLTKPLDAKAVAGVLSRLEKERSAAATRNGE